MRALARGLPLVLVGALLPGLASASTGGPECTTALGWDAVNSRAFFLVVIRQFETPGRAEVLGIVAYRGVPFEECYESRVPFLVPGRDEIRRIEKPW